ncbi:ABC transporter ATP-binding protein [Jeotgalicoccus nanhaiensis]|jgi:ABC-type multidrug transport system, ATPase component|uniref:ABC transporter ATP-binding protein n=1 Tax=Jeotgalicoccus nanhaiensis TaxID=568603 RepID=A0ABR9Y0L3_9STAP|nr:ABC transporter ATP-binding protein [Jeotgalicoccus nanhaiensis]MBF0754536.1 ABC transporter ATP-binding protein [Jeotgalicoccus nanhaiensis]TFU61056.1 ABC transporter ATP-binding protein [Jeotgalicoccus nanhaiensis]
MVLEINQLTGGYSKEPVIHDISFNIKSGEIIGLIGLNGAGKSTTIKHILGLLRPHSGSIKVMDTAIETDVEAYRRHMGYIPESPILYEELTLREHINMTAMAYGLTPEEVESRKGPLLKRFRLEDKEDTFPSHFSKGMKQKVMLICAFIVEPDLYIIDEPFLGLDPLGIESLIELMISERDKNRSILMSTHILATAERYCDRYIIIDQGRKIADGTLNELRELTGLREGTLDDVYIRLTGGKHHEQ